MSVEPETGIGRVDLLVDRATRIACPPGSEAGTGSPRSGVRLLAWIAMFAVCCPMLWTLVSRHGGPCGGPEGGGPGDRAGRRGRGRRDRARVPRSAAHGAGLCRDGRAGAQPDRFGHGRRRPRTRLADPDDPGGSAGRAVIEGTLTRPDRPTSRRATRRWCARKGDRRFDPGGSRPPGADNLASGSAFRTATPNWTDAGDGGSCGSVRWCVGAEAARPSGSRSNTGFANATTRLNMAHRARRREVRPGSTCASSPAGAVACHHPPVRRPRQLLQAIRRPARRAGGTARASERELARGAP